MDACDAALIKIGLIRGLPGKPGGFWVRIIGLALRVLVYSLPLIFLALFFFYPLLAILRLSLLADRRWQWDVIGETLGAPFFWQVLWFTTWQATASTLLTLAIGLPLAYVLAHFDFRGKGLLQALMTIPFVMPTVVVAAAFTTLLGERGIVNQWLQHVLGLSESPVRLTGTIWIILLAHAFYNVSIVARTVGVFWRHLNPAIEEAAAVLGATPIRRLWEITLPLLLPSIFAAGLLVFLFCFTSFGVVLILGGLQFATLEVEIYRQAVSLFNLPVASVLALVQIGLTFAIMAVYTRLQARASLPLELRPGGQANRAPHYAGARLIVALIAGTVLLLLLAPLVALAWRSFTLGGEGASLQFYRELAINRRQSAFFVAPVVAIRNSLFFALIAMTISLVLGLISAYLLGRPRRWWTAILDPIFLLPLGVSAVTLGFGYIIAMGSLRTSIWLTPIAHSLIAMPFVVRTFLPALRSLDPRLRESAAVLGASPPRVWWEIDAPLLYPAALVGAVFAFTISLGEFGATLLVSRPDFPTMPMVIYRALGQPGLLNYGQALAMSTILMAVAAVAMLVIERFRIGSASEF
jgi:thiamine transport system permease protein